MPRPPALRRLTIFLLKEEAGTETGLREREMTEYPVPALDDAEGVLFVLPVAPRRPSWVTMLEPHVEGTLTGILTSSSSAVLRMRVADRVFALTFGHGRHLIDPEAVEHDFGLRVTLNSVAPDQLKSVDARTIEELTVHTRRDVSRDAALSAFGLDVSRDLVRAVTGTPRDEDLARRLTGSDALALSTRIQLPRWRELLERLLVAYQAEDYKDHFDFIDHLRPEMERVPELQEALIEALRAFELDDVHLAAPEPVDWLDIEGFRFSSQDAQTELDPDPRISEYLRSIDLAALDLSKLRGDRVIPVRASDGQPLARWPIYRCIVYEVELDGSLFVLSGGNWYRVGLGFKQDVHDFVESLPSVTATLPDPDAGTDEEAYNLKAAAAMAGLCLDQRLVYDDGPDKMEICDILTTDGALLHVKQRGASSTLSHLFAQGLNCAERLLQDGDFRDRAHRVVVEADPNFGDLLSTDRPAPEEHEIGFVVITRSRRTTPLTLPFFSLVSLRAAALRLQTMGFPVTASAVHEPIVGE